MDDDDEEEDDDDDGEKDEEEDAIDCVENEQKADMRPHGQRRQSSMLPEKSGSISCPDSANWRPSSTSRTDQLSASPPQTHLCSLHHQPPYLHPPSNHPPPHHALHPSESILNNF